MENNKAKSAIIHKSKLKKNEEIKKVTRKKYTSRKGSFVSFGYPAVEYKKGIDSIFASVTIK